jgi:polyisoprenyl-phosphate glycosyltransferase
MSLISFVLPIYNEADNIEKLWEELQNLKKSIRKEFKFDNFQFEFIFVNDGSRDKSAEKLKQLYKANPDEVKLRIFGRNFGHQIAVTAGQDVADGDAVIIMDTDLQDPPSVCLDLIKKWQEGYDVVYAKRKKYQVSLIKKIPAFVFYRLMSRIANVEIPEDTGDFRLLSKKVNLEMRKFREKNRYLRGISFLTGFSTASVTFDRSQRYAGKPVYTFMKSLKLAFDGITSFSLFPIRLVTMTGFVFALFGVIGGSLYVVTSLFFRPTVSGWASLMFSIFFLGGIQLLMLGIIGEYIGRIYIEVLDRPLYTVVESYGFNTDNETK